MKLSEIVADIKALKATISNFVSDKAAATATALEAFQAKLTSLDTAITGEITQLSADLATAKQSVSSLTTEKTEVATKLDNAQTEVNLVGQQLKVACEALKIDTKDKTNAQMISALQTSVSDTLAKLHVDPKVVPAGKPAGPAGVGAIAELKGRAKMLAATRWEGMPAAT